MLLSLWTFGLLFLEPRRILHRRQFLLLGLFLTGRRRTARRLVFGLNYIYFDFGVVLGLFLMQTWVLSGKGNRNFFRFSFLSRNEPQGVVVAFWRLEPHNVAF